MQLLSACVKVSVRDKVRVHKVRVRGREGDSCLTKQSQNVMVYAIVYIPCHCRARSSMLPSMGE